MVAVVLSLLIGFGIGFLLSDRGADCQKSSLRYINLDLDCKNNPLVSKKNYVELKNRLETFIQDNKTANTVTDVSVYFRDLQNGPTLGIDEYALFSPASLLKLPLLLTYENLKDTTQPDLFNQTTTVKDDGDTLIQIIPPKQSAKIGRTYSIGDLLTLMMTYSDNNSYFALLDYLQKISPNVDVEKQTFVDLGVVDPQDVFQNTISVKAYGSIFTQLYNASYFNNEETSDDVLSLLTRTDWKDGINAGVPSSVTVAHKFGERQDLDNGVTQLHDCGIVYYPGNPYLLCIMTRGHDIKTLAGVISSISKMVYTEFDSRKI